MKKGFLFLALLIIFLSGCRENVVVVSDQYWERYIETGGSVSPDWSAILKKAGYSPQVLIKPPTEEEWNELSRKRSPEFVFWGPFWVEEAYEFSKVHPEINALAAFPPVHGEVIPENMTHLSPLRLEALRETGKRLSEAAGPAGKVISIFYTGDSGRKAEYEVFLEGLGSGVCEHEEITFTRQGNIQPVLEFLDRFRDETVSFLFIAGAGKTSDIYNSAKKKISARILVEIPNLPGNQVEENPSIMHYLWEDTIKSIIHEEPEEWARDYDVPISIRLWNNEN